MLFNTPPYQTAWTDRSVRGSLFQGRLGFQVVFFILLCFGLNVNIQGQVLTYEWENAPNRSRNQGASAMVPTMDDGFVQAGTTADNLEDGHLIKTDDSGVVVWTADFGGSLADRFFAVTETNDGSIVAAGYTRSTDNDLADNPTNGGEDFLIVKYDAAGNYVMDSVFGGTQNEVAYDVIATSDGGFIMTGFAVSQDGDVGPNGRNNPNVWVIKLDAIFAIEWKTVLGGNDAEWGFSVVENAQGEFAVAGFTNSSDIDLAGNTLNGRNDYWLILLDASGNLIWQDNYGGPGHDVCYDVIATDDGGYALSGQNSASGGDVSTNFGGQDYWLVKVDATGGLEWEQSYGGSLSDNGRQVLQTPDNGFAIIGSTSSSDGLVSSNYGASDFWLVKTDTLGVLECEKNFGGSNGDAGENIVDVGDGKFVLGGSTVSTDGDVVSKSSSSFDFWILKTIPSIPISINCPPDLTIECDESQQPFRTGYATLTTSYPVLITPSFTDSVVFEGGNQEVYTIYRNWYIDHNCNGPSTCQQIITILDLKAPLITDCPPNQNLNAADSANCMVTVTWTEPTSYKESCSFDDFIGILHPNNWELDLIGPGGGTDGDTSLDYAPDTLIMTGSTDGTNPDRTTTEFCFDFEYKGELHFSWSAMNPGTFAGDRFGYELDGSPTELLSSPGMSSDAGNEIVPILVSDRFCFRVNSDNDADFSSLKIFDLSFKPDVTITKTGGPDVGDQLTPGVYTVTYEAEDISGNTSECSFDLRVGGSNELLCKNVNVSLDASCEVTVYPEMVLSGQYNCLDHFEVEVLDQGISLGTMITLDELGKTLDFIVRDPGNGNSCWGTILVEDKQPPTFDVCRNATVNCIDFAFNNIPLPTATDLCQEDTVLLVDQLITKTPCNPRTVMTVLRKYVAVDQSGNISLDTCRQEITVTRFPIGSATLIGQNRNTNVSCSSGFEVDANGYIKPEFVSVPMLGALKLYPYNDEFCDIYINYTDILIYEIGCELQILRTWKIREWHCNIQREQILQQYITIIDDRGPSITGLPDSLYAKAGQRSCDADVDMPVAVVKDACHDGDRVDMIYPGGSMQYQNGGRIRLPVGFNSVVYRAYDSCYNVTEDTVIVHVQDKVAPIAICEEFLTITLGANGTVDIPASTFDDGSFDECALERFEVRRMDTVCASNGDQWGPAVTFCCEDIGDTVMVPFRVIDSSGNAGGCMVRVFVKDEQAPRVIHHLPNIIVECIFDFDTSNLSVFGNFVTDPSMRDSIIKQPEFTVILGPPLDGLVMDNCELTIREEVDIDSINQCGQGRLLRKFTFSDPYGNVATSIQTIYLEDAVPFNERDIIWPEHLDTFNICDIDSVQPGLLPIEHGFPRFLRNDECSLVGYDFEDDVIDASQGNEACYKVLRYWTVIDWCQKTTSGRHETWRDTQVIVVTNTNPPVFDGSCQDTVKCFFKNDCDPDTITLIASAMDDCTKANDLFWTFKIDIGNDGSFDTIGHSNNASGVYPLDTHRIKYIVEDLCGNKDSCEFLFELRNCKGPIAYCDDSLAFRMSAYDTTTPPDGVLDYKFIDVPAHAFYALDSGQVQNCGRPFFISYDSTDIFDTIRRFECDDIGFDSIYIYYIDTFVDVFSSCLVTYEVQDTMLGPTCPTFTGTVSGLMMMSDGQMVENVGIDLSNSGMNTVMSDRTGSYAFPNMPIGGIYEVIPSKNGDDLNGVSTADLVALQRHLLGKKEISDPYQLIAGDVNNSRSISAADISELRRLILGVYSEFPDNSSWRFVDASHTFSNTKNPWQDNWPEKYRIEPFVQDMNVDFYSVKVGDVTGDVQVIGLGGNNQSRSVEHLLVRDRSIKEGEMISVAFQLPNVEEVQGYQFTLEWNTDYLEYLGLIPNTGFDVDFHNFSEHMVEKGALTTSWHTTSSWYLPSRADRTMFTVEFKASRAGRLSDFIQTSGLITANEVLYQGNESVAKMQLLFDNETSSHFFALYQNVPNPWEEVTTIAFHLPEADKVTLTVFDESGRSLKVENGQFERGYNEIQIRRDELSGSGVLFYRVETSSHTAMKKMIMMK